MQFVILFCALIATVSSTPLDDYVWKDDGYFKYELLRDRTYKSPGVTSYTLNMTSQRWLTDADTTRSIWWHYLIINIPDVFDPAMENSGYLLIDGGGNTDTPPDTTDTFVEFMSLIAVSTGSVTADLKQIPNEHLMFKEDPEKKSRTEDGIIAYTWRHFIDDPTKPEWLLRMPMTKASVKAMDAVTDFVNKTVGKVVENYCVGGASKRGWTTWTTGAVDYKRVKCITPIVLDVLNMVPNLHHHYRAYGGWSFAMEDYYEQNITRDLDHPNTQKMADIVDPISYKDRLTMPKMIFNSGGDEFFLPDDSHYYLTEMEGPTYVNMLPNAEHSCAGHELQLFFNIKAFYVSVMKGFTLPQVSWTFASTATGGIIEVTMDTKPVLVRYFHAVSESKTRRDFRLLKGGPNGPTPQVNLWAHANATKIDEFHYKAEIDNPFQGGWRAFFIQMTFPGPDGTHFECTTETNIIPSIFPFPECYGDNCYGTLV
uniref:autocrine proliferation repressor protein A-like n=1 Tax=Styela clava TaxID=7725 RepID=UPI001939DD31|nr:autocrine proliferation repressor protein A-like [Styela clava]